MQQFVPEAEALRIAEEMHQGCVGLRVGRLHRLVSRRFEQALRPLGLSLPQLEVLSALTLWGGPARPAQLAEALSIERSTMSRNLALLETRGLVASTETSPTGRSMAVTVMPEGTRLLAGARAVWSKTQEDILTRLGSDVPGTLSAWISGLSDP